MTGSIELGEYVRPQDGEALSGDVVLIRAKDNGVFVAVIDVLGHGAEAHQVGVRLRDRLAEWVDTTSEPEADGALETLHEVARGTRGAVAAVMWISLSTLEGWAAGVGNARCRVFSDKTRTVEFPDGVLGQRVRSAKPQTLSLKSSDVVVLFSDGITSRFGKHDYPSLGLDPAPTIALNVVQRFGKGLDDASCVVVRCK